MILKHLPNATHPGWPQSLVKRLGEYKSYMPASLFQPASVNVNGAVIEKETESGPTPF